MGADVGEMAGEGHLALRRLQHELAVVGVEDHREEERDAEGEESHRREREHHPVHVRRRPAAQREVRPHVPVEGEEQRRGAEEGTVSSCRALGSNWETMRSRLGDDEESIGSRLGVGWGAMNGN